MNAAVIQIHLRGHLKINFRAHSSHQGRHLKHQVHENKGEALSRKSNLRKTAYDREKCQHSPKILIAAPSAPNARVAWRCGSRSFAIRTRAVIPDPNLLLALRTNLDWHNEAILAHPSGPTVYGGPHDGKSPGAILLGLAFLSPNNHVGNIGYTSCMTNKPILNFSIDPALLQRIENYWHRHQFPTRAAAVKWLLDWALKQNPNPAAQEKGR